MRDFLPEPLLRLAETLPAPLYLVGGSVRDRLLGDLPTPDTDYDLASPCGEDVLTDAARRCGMQVKTVYPATGTVKLASPEGAAFEFTRFRSDKYVRGLHAPSEISFTTDIATDAVRRDFRANAVYYDIEKGTYEDPLGGIADIRARVLRTVAPASKVFGEDGLRLMRLARIAAQTGFSPDEDCLAGAAEHAALIRDIVPERIFAELSLLLHSDEKRGLSDAPYRGLVLMRDTGVLRELLPELASGAGMEQRREFHDHDVLEHSLRCVLYSRSDIRFAALLHDAGKPVCFLRDGNYHGHPEEGAIVARNFLEKLKAPKKLTEETVALVRLHMRDYDLNMREGKLRRELIENLPLLDKLLALKQADFSACKDVLSEAPCVTKWNAMLARMKEEGVPFTLSALAVKGDDLLALGAEPKRVGELLKELQLYCAENGRRNRREHLLARAKRMLGL